MRPGLIYVSINCYGHEGPWVERPGWEQLAQTVTGIAAEQGGASSPRLLPAAATDYNTGYLAALGTMVALARRAREGGSWLVRSLSQTGMWLKLAALRIRRRRSDGRAGPPVPDSQRHPVRKAGAPGTDRRDVRDEPALGAADRPARHASRRVGDGAVAPQIRSTIVEMPMPAPMHWVARP